MKIALEQKDNIYQFYDDTLKNDIEAFEDRKAYDKKLSIMFWAVLAAVALIFGSISCYTGELKDFILVWAICYGILFMIWLGIVCTEHRANKIKWAVYTDSLLTSREKMERLYAGDKYAPSRYEHMVLMERLSKLQDEGADVSFICDKGINRLVSDKVYIELDDEVFCCLEISKNTIEIKGW